MPKVSHAELECCLEATKVIVEKLAKIRVESLTALRVTLIALERVFQPAQDDI